VTAAFPATFPAKHHTPQDCGVPRVCQATQFGPPSPKTQEPCPPVVTRTPSGSKRCAAATAAAALPAGLQSKKVCPCPLSCSIWQPVRQQPSPAGQQVPPQVRPVVQTQVPPEHV
jgi:hypothetical protein